MSKTERTIQIKRAYDRPEADDGIRILVDRLWPRGMSKTRMAVDFWSKDMAPSTGLRKWFGHDPAQWEEFRRRYRAELKGRRTAVDHFRKHIEGQSRITLVYAAKDSAHTHALVLREFLQQVL